MAMAIPKRIGEIAIVPTVATDRSNALLKNWLYHRERLFLTEMTTRFSEYSLCISILDTGSSSVSGTKEIFLTRGKISSISV